MKKSSLTLPIAFAGLGGAINAFLVFAGVPISFENQYLNFEWHIVPAGFIHGALLAYFSAAAANIAGKKKSFQLILFPVVGYIAGWISGIPLTLSISDKPEWSVLWWPLEQSQGYEMMVAPFLHFGLVSALYYFGLVVLDVRSKKNIFLHVFTAAAAGVLGSLYWWLSLDALRVSFLHGSIWGLGAGFGYWKQNFKRGK